MVQKQSVLPVYNTRTCIGLYIHARDTTSHLDRLTTSCSVHTILSVLTIAICSIHKMSSAQLSWGHMAESIDPETCTSWYHNNIFNVEIILHYFIFILFLFAVLMLLFHGKYSICTHIFYILTHLKTSNRTNSSEGLTDWGTHLLPLRLTYCL